MPTSLTPEVIAELRKRIVPKYEGHKSATIPHAHLSALLDLAERVCPECGGGRRDQVRSGDMSEDGVAVWHDCHACSGTGWRERSGT